MTVTFTNGGSATRADMQSLQQFVGDQLPQDYVEFTARYDGAVPESNEFTGTDSKVYSVKAFIPLREIPQECLNIENLPVKTFPVAWDECGNYILLSTSSEVYFWDHELPDPIVKIASSFAELLEKLEPFDPDSVQLDPDQVISVWVHPDLQKIIEQSEKNEGA